jgi:prevent-host-death family protein
MKTATVRDLRNRFARVSEWIEDGEAVELTKRGKVIARIMPVRARKKATVQWPDFMARLKRIYGDRVSGDSQAIIDEGRGAR